jgi:hypothetical protein
MQLVTAEPAVVVHLGARATASTNDRTDEARLLVDDVRDLLAPRRSRMAMLVGYWRRLGFLAVLLATTALGFAASLALSAPARIANTWVVSSIATIALAVWIESGTRRFGDRGYCIVVPERRSERRGLSQRTRLELISGLIGATLGVAVTIVVAVLTARDGGGN